MTETGSRPRTTTEIAQVWITSGIDSGEFGFVILHGGHRAEDVRFSHVHDILAMLGHSTEAIETAITAAGTVERFTTVTVA
jgi:hypothetical protein